MSQKVELLICRICRGNYEADKLTSLYENYTNCNSKCYEIVQEFGQISIGLDDELSKWICILCKTDLDTAYQFRKKCQESDCYFHENKTGTCYELDPFVEVFVKGEINNLVESETQSDNQHSLEEKFSTKTTGPINFINSTNSNDDNGLSETEELIEEDTRTVIECEDLKVPNKNHDISIYSCSICEHRKFRSQKCLSQHLKRKHSRKKGIFKCNFCNKNYLYHNHLKSHIRKSHTQSDGIDEKCNSLNWKCSQCNQLLNCENDLKIHMTACPKLYCDLCDKHFTKKGPLLVHAEKFHDEDGVQCIDGDVTLESRFVCTMCSEKFKYEILLRLHVERHRKDERSSEETCDECPKTFLSKLALAKHVRAVHEKRYSCDLCSKSYYHENSLKVHRLKLHLNQTNFICSFCGKSFIQSFELTLHLRKHTNDLPYKCTDCDKQFSQKSELTVHVKSKHTFERNFKCAECDKTYLTNNHLKQHVERRHHKGERERNFVCEICHFGFFSKNHLIRHMKKGTHRSGKKRK